MRVPFVRSNSASVKFIMANSSTGGGGADAAEDVADTVAVAAAAACPSGTRLEATLPPPLCASSSRMTAGAAAAALARSSLVSTTSLNFTRRPSFLRAAGTYPSTAAAVVGGCCVCEAAVSEAEADAASAASAVRSRMRLCNPHPKSTPRLSVCQAVGAMLRRRQQTKELKKREFREVCGFRTYASGRTTR